MYRLRLPYAILSCTDPRFIQTKTRLISEGETPEIREAWPRVEGRIFANFCLASILKLGT